MDVLLEQNSANRQPRVTNVIVNTAELLQARDFAELVREARQLERRRVDLVSVRRQRAMRIGPARLKAVLDDTGLGVCTVGFAGGFTGSLGCGYKAAVDDTRRALELAAELKAHAVIVAPGSRERHTYNHAQRTIRDGLEDCLDDALRLRINMVLPLNAIFGNRKDVFHPRDDSPLDWVSAFESHRIRPMMTLRGSSPWNGLPDCWQRCLNDGGVLRVSARCRAMLGGHNVLSDMLSQLTKSAVAGS
ncbi:MAG TPA: sugar phosphate isomerase/epimerase [Planctomycetes bacterium]|nr:sugar phosphate isomerase/epimerase [Fuerstiella sp.]HIK92219.1 sugar phosphate isomerase/epimerase [Planctomycetota bacterium]